MLEGKGKGGDGREKVERLEQVGNRVHGPERPKPLGAPAPQILNLAVGKMAGADTAIYWWLPPLQKPKNKRKRKKFGVGPGRSDRRHGGREGDVVDAVGTSWTP